MLLQKDLSPILVKNKLNTILVALHILVICLSVKEDFIRRKMQ